MDTPKISVIVPVYNVEKYLRQCLDSILAQTFTDFELLLIDDGSPDTSGTICDEYAALDSRVRVFHKENGGVSSARNLGLDNAQGEWITFVDADDEIKECFLSTFVDIQNEKNAELIVTSVEFFHSKESIRLSILSDGFYDKSKYGELIIYLRDEISLLGVPWNKLYNSEIIKKNNVRFDEGISSYEDEIFVIQYMHYANSVATSSKVTYNHIERGNVTLSRKYIPMKIHFRTAEILYRDGLKLSGGNKYLAHIRYHYVRHITRVIATMYFLPNEFNRKERLLIIRTTLNKAQAEGIIDDVYSQLRGYSIICRSPLAIDINGVLTKYIGKAKMKKLLRAILPNRIVKSLKKKV